MNVRRTALPALLAVLLILAGCSLKLTNNTPSNVRVSKGNRIDFKIDVSTANLNGSGPVIADSIKTYIRINSGKSHLMKGSGVGEWTYRVYAPDCSKTYNAVVTAEFDYLEAFFFKKQGKRVITKFRVNCK